MADETQTTDWETSLPMTRPRLVRLCAQPAGSPAAAEDLAQETLFEAWRLRARRAATAPAGPWVAAIARSVCLWWSRAQGRELRRLAPLPAVTGTPDEAIAAPPDRCDIEAELEGSELVEFLDRAMAQLPANTLVPLAVHGTPRT